MRQVKELTSLRRRSQTIQPRTIDPGNGLHVDLKSELFEFTTEIEIGSATQICFNLRGVEAFYDAATQELSCAGRKGVLKPQQGKLQLRGLVDRTSLDIFGNDGRLYMAIGMALPEGSRSMEITVKGGTAQLRSLKIYELKSAWK
ncbi:MAG TPA: GH32 C-terminal domain-containing protein [Clostridia bacterium]|nr:GH32 C-terminal domain-containing protein [Clostridia bacterium]